MNLSISNTALEGGDLGWISENAITKKFKSKIINTPVGSVIRTYNFAGRYIAF